MNNILNKISKISIYLLVFLLPLFFLPFSFEAYEFNKQYLLFFLVSVAFFAWITRMFFCDKEVKFRRTPLDIPVGVFMLVAIFSAIFSVDKFSSLLGFYGRFSDGLIGLLSLGVLYFLITNHVESSASQPDEKTISKISLGGMLKTFLWSSFFVILAGYFSLFGVWDKFSNFQLPIVNFQFGLPQVMLQRVFAPAGGSMEALSIFLVVTTVLLIGLLLSNKELQGKIKKFFYWVLLLASLFLLLIIDFAAAWIILGLSLFLFLVLALWKRMFREDVNRLLLPIFILFVSIIFLFTNPLTNLLSQDSPISNLPSEILLSQGDSWNITGQTLKSRPILGSGLGTFSYDFSKFRPAAFNQTELWQLRFDRAGNHISELISTMGVLGVLSYSILIGLFLIISYFFIQSQRKGKTGVNLSTFQLPLFLAFIALLISQFVYYQNTTLAFIFWLILGLSVASWLSTKAGGEAKKTFSFKEFPEMSLVFSAFLIIISLAIIGGYYFAGRFYRADISYVKAQQMSLGPERIELLERAAVLNPYQSQYRSILARAYLNEALNEAMKPIEKQNSEALTKYVNRAINYSKGGEIIDERGNIIRITGATELSPNRVFNWEIQGTIYRDIQTITAGATEWGIKAFEKAIELEPTNPVLYIELGRLLVIEKPEQAKEKFAKALELKPDYLDAQVQQALIAESEGKRDEAIKKMEELSLTYPFEVEISFQLGRLYFNNNQIDEAIPQFKKAIDLAPFHSNALYSLGVAYEAKGEKDLAIKEFEKVLELNPGNADVLSKLEELRAEEKE